MKSIGVATLVRVLESYRVPTPEGARVPFITRRGENARLYYLQPALGTHFYVIVSVLPDGWSNDRVIVFYANADGSAHRATRDGVAYRRRQGDHRSMLKYLGYEVDSIAEACAMEAARERSK